MNRFIHIAGAMALTLTACSKTNETSTAAVAEPASETGRPTESAEYRKLEELLVPGVAAITPETASAAGIEVAVAGPAEIHETLTLYGSITPNAERRQEIRARYAGVVRAVAKRPGDHVAKEELLLTIESNDSLEPYSIRSPIAGTVLERRVNVGETVDSSQALMVVADLSTVWAEIAVFARDLDHVRAGQAVFVQAADAEQRADGHIAYVAPAGHTDSQSVVARAELDNQRRDWVPGQFVTADVVVAEVNAPVTVTPAALQTLNGKPVVFIESARGFEAREIETGHRSKSAIEVVSGMSAGERYAAENSYLIKSDLLKGTGEEE